MVGQEAGALPAARRRRALRPEAAARMSPQRLVAIHLVPRPGGAPVAHDRVEALSGRGLVGDRHARAADEGGWAREVTLIGAETLAHLEALGLGLGPGESRRQLTTQGVDLRALVGQRFTVGAVLLEGTKECRPCAHLESLTRPGVLAALEGRGGLCARILVSGVLHVGDPVRPEAPGAGARPGAAP